MVYSFDDCLRDGLLRRIPRSPERARNSLRAAEKWLREARSTYEAEAYNSALMCVYLCMFHSARSVLYRDGYREKSHYCVARFLENEYVNKGKLEQKWVNILDHYRDQRHRNQYTFALDPSKDEVFEAIETAQGFHEILKTL